MTMVVTPSRRHEKVLKQRGANRRMMIDVESDSCVERDENDGNKSISCNSNSSSLAAVVVSSPSTPTSTTPKNNSNAGSGSGGVRTQSSFQLSSSSDKQQRRQRRKRGTSASSAYYAWRVAITGMALMLVVLVMMSCWLILVEPKNRTTSEQQQLSILTTTTESRMMSEQQQRPSSSSSRFELFSFQAPTSCANHPVLDVAKGEVDYTLVTQVSPDRLWMMRHHCQRWKIGKDDDQSSVTLLPISIAVYTNDTKAQIQEQLREMGCDLRQVTVAILDASHYSVDNYPVNILRNMALGGVQTSHVVYIDIDFWISSDLATLLQLPNVTHLLASDPKATLVIAAFQMIRQCHQWRECPEKNVPEMPLNLTDLKRQILAKKVTRFDPTNHGGHGSTRYKDWFQQTKEGGDVLVEIDCFLSNRYEPYLVFRYCQELPPFQEPFSGYGKNKMTWVMHLRRLGYTFWQLGRGAFVIHYPHLDSPSRIAWNAAPPPQSDNDPHIMNLQSSKRAQMDSLFVEFRDWLHRQVPDLTRTPFCSEGKLDDDSRLIYDRSHSSSRKNITTT